MAQMKSVEIVRNALAQKGVESAVVEFSSSTRTAQDAAQAIGCSVAQIVKSLVFKTAESGRPVIVLASGPNRVNERTIELHVGEKILKADAEFVRAVTGFAIGGVPPVGYVETVEHFYIDRDLLAHDVVWAAAGTPHTVVSLKNREIVNVTGGTVISIV